LYAKKKGERRQTSVEPFNSQRQQARLAKVLSKNTSTLANGKASEHTPQLIKPDASVSPHQVNANNFFLLLDMDK